MAAADRNRRIGVFDSGVGGLTVLKALREVFPARPFVYLGDTARLPYGTKSGDTIVRYAVQAAGLLAAQDIGLLIVACNTASAYALPALRERFPNIPVIGMIEPGAMAAVQASRSHRIAVLCTESTAKAGAYQTAIARLAPTSSVTIVSCSLMVALAEEGWTTGDVPQRVAAHYLAPLFADPATAPDTLVLGCTHFPLLRASIAAACPLPVTIIDSGSVTAAYVADTDLSLWERSTSLNGRAGEGLCAGHNQPLTRPSFQDDRPLPQGEGNAVRFLATDGADRFARVAGYFLGTPVDAGMIELVDLGPLP